MTLAILQKKVSERVRSQSRGASCRQHSNSKSGLVSICGVLASLRRGTPKAGVERKCSVDSWERAFTAADAPPQSAPASAKLELGCPAPNSSAPGPGGLPPAKKKVVAVDQSTVVPEGIYASLLDAAKAMENDGQHKLITEEVFLEVSTTASSTDIANCVESFSRGTTGGSEASTISIGSRQRLVRNGVISKKSTVTADQVPAPPTAAAPQQQAPNSESSTTPAASPAEVGEGRRRPRRIVHI